MSYSKQDVKDLTAAMHDTRLVYERTNKTVNGLCCADVDTPRVSEALAALASARDKTSEALLLLQQEVARVKGLVDA